MSLILAWYCTQFYFLNFWRTYVLFLWPLIPLFCTSGDIPPGFQSQGGSLFVCFLECVICRFTTGVTHADCNRDQHGSQTFSIHILADVSIDRVEVQARAWTHDCLCGKHSTVYHWPLQLSYCVLMTKTWVSHMEGQLAKITGVYVTVWHSVTKKIS